MQTAQQKRLVPKFDELENKKIDDEIKKIIDNMTQKLSTCDKNIKDLSYYECDNNNEEMIRDNIKNNLAEKIRNFYRKFKSNEEKYVRDFKELVVTDDGEKLDNQQSKTTSNNFLQMAEEEEDNYLHQRNQQITNLVNSINNLANTFKDIQIIVHEQGTILDRIDYNIETATEYTKTATKHLKKANEYMKQNCYRNASILMMLANFGLAVWLLFKFTK